MRHDGLGTLLVGRASPWYGLCVSRPLLILLVATLGACDPSGAVLQLDIYERRVPADDGEVLSAFDLQVSGRPRDEGWRAWMFYLVGSEPVSIHDSTGQYADFVAQGVRVVLLQPRGVSRHGTVDLETFRRHETRARRVADEIAVMNAYLGDSNELPVVLVGSSQGGVVAADVAASDARVSHLFVMASGGGWTQAEELAHLIEVGQSFGGVSNLESLAAKLEEIEAAPDSDELWAGHPFRMWSSYLDFRSMDGLSTLSIPMFMAQGTEDAAVPVESARAMRDEFARLGKTNLTYVEYTGLDHHFSDSAGESRFEALQQDTYEWLSSTGIL